MLASIVLVLQESPEQALRAVQALAAQPEVPEHEVVVVDDGATGLEPLLTRLEGDVEIVRSARRTGFASAARMGVERARGEVVVLLRDAPEVAPGWLAPLLHALADEDVAAVSSATAGHGAGSPVAAHALALRRSDFAAVAQAAATVPEGAEIAALCLALSSSGRRVEEVAASVVAAPGARTGGARRAPGESVELTVVIPTLDAAGARLRACVAALQRGTDAPHQIVVVDNGAPPQGFTAPVNAGLRAMRGRYAVVLNDDVEVLPGWWPPLRAALDAGATVAFPHTIDTVMRDDFAAWCFAMTAGTVERFGHAPGEFFDPSLVVWYQDTDLLERLRAAGSPPLCVPESRIRHGLSVTVASEDPVLRAWIDRQVRLDQEQFLAKHPQVSYGRPAA